MLKKYFAHYSKLPSACWPGIVLSLIEATLGGVVMFLSFYFVNYLHVNVATAGMIISCYGIGTACGGIIGGKLADCFPMERVATSGLLIQAVALLCLIKLQAVNLLMLDLFLYGVALYVFITANNTWVLSFCAAREEYRLQAINLLYIAANLGLGLSALLVVLLSAYDFKLVFLTSSTLLFAIVIYFNFLLKVKKYPASHQVSPAAIAKIEDRKRQYHIAVLILCCLFSVGLIISARNAVYLIYIHHAFPAMGMTGVGFLFAINPLLIVLFQSSLVHAVRSMNKMLIVGTGAFLMGFGLLLQTMSLIFSMAVISCIVYTIGEMLFFSMAQLVFYQQAPTSKKGGSFGIFKTVYAISVIIGPALGGMIYHHVNANMLWVVCGLLSTVCLMACYYYRNN